jgi:hypothetical protein
MLPGVFEKLPAAGSFFHGRSASATIAPYPLNFHILPALHSFEETYYLFAILA